MPSSDRAPTYITTHYNDIKYVLEQPPILFVLANVLKEEALYQEACNLTLVLQSPSSRTIINNVFVDVVYRHHYNNTTHHTFLRFCKKASNLMQMCQGFSTNKNLKSKSKIIISLLNHFVTNKEIVMSHPAMKEVVIQKIHEYRTYPKFGEVMLYYISVFDL